MKHTLNMKKLAKDSKYLGNPIHIGTNKKKAFDDLKCRIEDKLQGWKASLLLQARRSTFIKFVVNAMPAYFMACCKLPLTWSRNVK